MTTIRTTYSFLAGGLVGLLAIVATLAFVILWRKRLACRQNKLPISQMPIMESSRVTASVSTNPVPSPLSFPDDNWPKAPLSGNGLSGEWVEFAAQRLAELAPQKNPDEVKWALGVVDFLDELREAEGEASAAERSWAASFRKALMVFLSAKGFAPVDSGEWNPDMQRAVAVVRNPDATGTTILGKGATGLSRYGKIIRKQEVKIEMKGT